MLGSVRMADKQSRDMPKAGLGRLADRLAWPVGILLVAFGGLALLRKVLGAPGWPNVGTDLGVYLNAARTLTHGGNMYDKINYAFDPYGYPPLFAELIATLRVVFGEGRLWLIWTGFSAGCLFASLAIMMRGFGVKLSWKWVTLAFGALVAGHMARIDFYHGQPHFILLLLIVLGVRAFSENRHIAGGLAWAAVMVCKPFTGTMVFILLRRGEWRAAITTLVAAGVLFGGSFLVFIPDIVGGVRDWMKATGWHTGMPNVAKGANETFYGLFQRLFGEAGDFVTPWAHMPGIIPFLAAPFLLIAIWGIYFGVSSDAQLKAAPAAERGALELLQAATVLGLTMSCGPLMEPPHCFMLLPGLVGSAMLAERRWSENSPVKWRWVAAATAWVMTFVTFLIPVSTPITNFHALGHLSGATILLTVNMGFFVLLSCVLSVVAQLGDRSAQAAGLALRVRTQGNEQAVS